MSSARKAQRRHTPANMINICHHQVSINARRAKHLCTERIISLSLAVDGQHSSMPCRERSQGTRIEHLAWPERRLFVRSAEVILGMFSKAKATQPQQMSAIVSTALV